MTMVLPTFPKRKVGRAEGLTLNINVTCKTLLVTYYFNRSSCAYRFKCIILVLNHSQ